MNHKIDNCVEACRHPDKSGAYRDYSDIRLILLHRLDPRDEKMAVDDTAEAVAEFLRAKYGWTMSYTFFLPRTGAIHQARLLTEVTPHALNRNKDTLGVAVSGDHRNARPTGAQFRALFWLLPRLCQFLHLRASDIRGHDEVPDSSTDLGKICPGQYLDPAKVRTVVGGYLYVPVLKTASTAREALVGAGLQLEK